MLAGAEVRGAGAGVRGAFSLRQRAGDEDLQIADVGVRAAGPDQVAEGVEERIRVVVCSGTLPAPQAATARARQGCRDRRWRPAASVGPSMPSVPRLATTTALERAATASASARANSWLRPPRPARDANGGFPTGNHAERLGHAAERGQPRVPPRMRRDAGLASDRQVLANHAIAACLRFRSRPGDRLDTRRDDFASARAIADSPGLGVSGIWPRTPASTCAETPASCARRQTARKAAAASSQVVGSGTPGPDR